MKRLLLIMLSLTIVLPGCKGDDGEIDGTKTIFLLIGIVAFFAVGAAQNRKQKEEKELLDADRQYSLAFSNALEKEGFTTSNRVTARQQFGLAVSDNFETIAYFSPNKELKVFDGPKILTCEYRTNYNEFINSKSKVPVVSWNTVANTKGEVIKTFASADIVITLKDLSLPFLKLRFLDEQVAEKYHALIHIVMKQETGN